LSRGARLERERNSLGDAPVRREKKRVKYAGSLNPSS